MKNFLKETATLLIENEFLFFPDDEINFIIFGS